MELFASSLTAAEIVGLPGFQEAVALYLTPPPRQPLSSWTALLAYLAHDVVGAPCERMRVLYLDARNGLIADEAQPGTVNAAPCYPREVIRRALELGACNLILTHNHPGGDPTPSTADIATTSAIRDAGKLFGIGLHDHIVTGAGTTASFKALGLL